MTWTTEPAANCLIPRLDSEWAHIHRRPPVLRTIGAWGLPLQRLLTDLDQVIVATHAREPDADRLLAQLVGLATDHELAGRILLQRILPGLILGARRYHHAEDPRDPVEIAVVASWESIRNYDAECRPHHIAAALISDALDRGFRRSFRRRARRELALGPTLLTEMPATAMADIEHGEPLVDLARVVRQARDAGLPQEDLDFVRDLVNTGSTRELARQRGVTSRTILNHQHRTVHRIRAAVLAA